MENELFDNRGLKSTATIWAIPTGFSHFQPLIRIFYERCVDTIAFKSCQI